jgi:hypothetical protein
MTPQAGGPGLRPTHVSPRHAPGRDITSTRLTNLGERRALWQEKALALQNQEVLLGSLSVVTRRKRSWLEHGDLQALTPRSMFALEVTDGRAAVAAPPPDVTGSENQPPSWRSHRRRQLLAR